MANFRCPRDASHARFQGVRFKRAEFTVDLQPNGSVIKEQVVAIHEPLSEVWDHEVVCIECGTTIRKGLTGLPFIPDAGMVLKCDFTRGFVKPEIVKFRPVVVISDRARNRGTTMVVACSTGQPRDGRTLAVQLPAVKYPFLKADNWAKSQMIYSVSAARLANLDDPLTGALLDSRNTRIDASDLAAIRAQVKQAAGIP